MIYHLLADGVLILHLLFLGFVGLGGLLALRWPRTAWLHVPAAVWGAAIALFGWTCPLTPLENRLRRRAGQAGFEGGFIEHYLMPLIYAEELTRPLYVALGAAVIVVNAAIYSWVWRRWKRRTGVASGPSRESPRK